APRSPPLRLANAPAAPVPLRAPPPGPRGPPADAGVGDQPLPLPGRLHLAAVHQQVQRRLAAQMPFELRRQFPALGKFLDQDALQRDLAKVEPVRWWTEVEIGAGTN